MERFQKFIHTDIIKNTMKENIYKLMHSEENINLSKVIEINLPTVVHRGRWISHLLNELNSLIEGKNEKFVLPP